MAKEGRVQPHSPGVGSSFDVLAQADNALERRIDSLEAATRVDRRRPLTVITPGSPFIITQVVVPKGIEVTCQIRLPPTISLQFITAIFRETASPVGQNREQRWEDIKQQDIEDGIFEGKFFKALDPSTEYGLVALMAKGEFPSGRVTRNPDPPNDAAFLTTWTTISFFQNDPSKPDTGLIIENQFDDVTEAYDAFIVIRIYAPINGILTAYSGTATINGTTTVTGTVPFAGEVAVGQLISILSQTREVISVTGSTLTVDLPFPGSGSGLELLWGIPHTWQTALVNDVIARFRLTDDPDAKHFDLAHPITDDEQTQTHVDYRGTGFVAARLYDWVQNILIGESGRRHIQAASTQTFFAGGFKVGTANLPELTFPFYRYDQDDPFDGKNVGVTFGFTQSDPAVALDRAELRSFLTLTGTIQITSNVVIGTGTLFVSELTEGGLLFVGAQTVEVLSFADDTHAVVTGATNVAPGATCSFSANVRDEQDLRRTKFHRAGEVVEMSWGTQRTKKLINQVFRTTIFSQSHFSHGYDETYDAGDVEESVPDIGDASAVLNLEMHWSSKKGLKATWLEPITNYTQPRGYVISHYVNVGGTTYWMDGITGAVIVSVVEAAVTPDERLLANTGGIKVWRHVDDVRDTTNLKQSEIAAIFQTNGVKARVRARNLQAPPLGKTISANKAESLNVVPGTDSSTPVPGALAFPGGLATNTVDGDPDKAQARIGITVATASATFAANNIRQIALILFRRNATDTGYLGDPLTETKTLTESERATSSATHEFFLRMGGRFHLVAVKAINGDQATETTGTLAFKAGNVLQVDVADAYTVPAPTYQVAAAIDGNKHVTATIRLTQDGTNIVLFKKLVIQSSTNGGAFEELFEIALKTEDTLYLNATSFKDFPIRVHRKPASSFQLRVFAVAVGGKPSANTDSSVLGAGLDDGATVPTAIAFPSAPSAANNTVDGDPEKALARIALTLATSSGTFTANNVSQIEIVIQRLDATGTPIANSDFSEIKILSTADLAATSCVHQFFLGMGRKFRITKVVARNGDKRAETTGTANFTAGNVLIVDTVDAKVVPAPTYQVAAAVDGNKHVTATIRMTQDGTDSVLFKKLVIQSKTAAGAFEDLFEIGLKAEDALYATAGTTNNSFKDFPIRVHRKPGADFQMRVFAVAVGGKVSANADSAALLASGAVADVATDTAVPTLATNPDTGNTGPSVQSLFGHIDCLAVTPSAFINTLDKFQFILQTANTTPAGNPTVGVEDVIKIKETPSGALSFRAKQTQYNATLWVRFRAHNGFGSGYSAWSAGTSIIPSRPLEDVIGDDVPTQPEKLERPNSGTFVDSTHYDLDGGASAVDEFYTGMTLFFAAASTGDTVVRITAYNGAARRCTIAPALSSSAGTTVFRIHRLGYPGDWSGRSGTGHSTTTFVLDSGASSVNDFYKGFSLWVPFLPSGDQFRKVIAYVGATRTCTVDTAFSAIPSNSRGFMLAAGSFGNDSVFGSGSTSAAPFRLYLDPVTDENVVEVLTPVGRNAYSLTDFQIRVYRESTGAVKIDSGLRSATGSTQWRFPSDPTQNRRVTVRFRNQFRGGGSDGWSVESAAVVAFLSTTGPVPGVPNYDPGNFPPSVGDFQGTASYPDQRYSIQ